MRILALQKIITLSIGLILLLTKKHLRFVFLLSIFINNRRIIMSNGISVGGLASGIDTNSIIDGLTNIEMQRVTRVEKQKEAVEKTQDSFNTLVTRINGLSSKASELSKESSFNLYATNSDDEDIVTISGDAEALEGEYNVEVLQMASSLKTASKGFAAINTSLGLSGSFQLSTSKSAQEADPTNTSVEVKIDSNESLKDVAAKINAAKGTGVTASILTMANGENRLVMTAVDKGTDSFFLEELSGGILGDAGLGVLSSAQATRAEEGFVLNAGGAATGASTFGDLAAGIGGSQIAADDQIQFDIKDAQGNAMTWNFAVGDGLNYKNMDDMVTELQTALNTNGLDLTASMNSSGEIVLTESTPGTGLESISLNMEMQDSGGTPTAVTLGGGQATNVFSNLITEGQKSYFKIDGLSFSSHSNNADNVVMGTSFNFHRVSEPGDVTHVSLRRDKDAIVGKINGLIEEYNSVLKYIDDKSKVKLEEDEDGKTDVQSKGPLYGDSMVQRLRAELQRIMTSPIDELEGVTQYSSLSRLGITTSRTTGHLEIDSEKLKEAIDTDFDGVKRLFMASGFSDNPSHEMGRYTNDTETGTYFIDADNKLIDTDKGAGVNTANANRIGSILVSKNGDSKGLSIEAPNGSGTGSFTFVRGLASQLKRYVDQANDYADGIFKQTKEFYNNKISDYDDRIFRLEEQVESFTQRLVNEFSAMEQSMSNLQQQSSSFLQQIGSL